MESFLAFDDLRATAGHIDLVQSKVDRLMAVREDSWRQLLTAVGRLYRDGTVSAVHLLQFHRDMRHAYGAGFTKVWDSCIDIRSSKLRWVVEREQRVAAQRDVASWWGTFPVDGNYDFPEKTIAVVYVLFDFMDVPAYVGSTDQFKERMKAHKRERPGMFARWVAYPCEDREAAYQLEEQLLRANLPYLNRKVTR